MTAALNGAIRRIPAWPLYVLAALYPAWLLSLALTGGLGVEPVERMEHMLGEAALKVLIATLAISPLRRWGGVSLIKYRRALGVIAFAFVALHLLVWAVLDVQDPARIWADILKRPYITIGMLGFLLLLPLAITSNDASVRWLRRRWQSLHKLAYPAIVLGAVHWVMLSRGWQWEPVLYLTAILALIALRWVPRQGRARAAA